MGNNLRSPWFRCVRFGALAGAAAFLASASALAEVSITLKRSFVEQHRSRATVTAAFLVDKAHAKPNPPKKDGDLHVAGRAASIGLPVVAELMNAADEPDAVAAIHDAERTGDQITLQGAWRLWTEHGGSDDQIQGQPVSPATTTNPDHVFQIHPLTKVGTIDVGGTLRPIQGFEPKDAERAFLRYENLRCRITRTTHTVTLNTVMGGYNYVAFRLRANQAPWEQDDAYFVMASVLDLEDELLVRNRRMVFIKGTPPAEQGRNLQPGETLDVLGIPRINLAILSWRLRNASTRPEVLEWTLPYEIVIVGVYQD